MRIFIVLNGDGVNEKYCQWWTCIYWIYSKKNKICDAIKQNESELANINLKI